MLARLPFRLLALLLFAVCAGMLAFGLYLQHAKGIEPCPMCIMQRYAFVVVGLFALIAALHNPRGRGGQLYAGLIGLAAATGFGIAARQSWLQWFPPKYVECGPDLEFMMNSFPLGQALPMIFQGSGDCAKVDWTFLGLSIANWAGLWFAAIFVMALTVLLQRRERSRFAN